MPYTVSAMTSAGFRYEKAPTANHALAWVSQFRGQQGTEIVIIDETSHGYVTEQDLERLRNA